MGHIGIEATTNGPFFGELPWFTNDDALLRECKNGNREALFTLYAVRRSELGKFIAVILGPGAQLEDVIAEVFLRAFRSIQRLKHSSKFDTWLKGLAVAAAVHHLRKRRFRLRLSRTGGRPTPVLQDYRVSPEVIYRHLDDLPLMRRTVLIMSEMQGLSSSEIAEILGAPPFVVRLVLYLARRRFYRRLFSSRTL